MFFRFLVFSRTKINVSMIFSVCDPSILVVLNFFHLKMIKDTKLCRTLKTPDVLLYISTVLSWRSIDSSFDPMACVFALTSAVNFIYCMGFLCLSKLSNELNLPQVNLVKL